MESNFNLIYENLLMSQKEADEVQETGKICCPICNGWAHRDIETNDCICTTESLHEYFDLSEEFVN